VVVAVAHHAMRALIVDLLARQQPGWAVSAVDGPAEVGAVLPGTGCDGRRRSRLRWLLR